MNVNNIEQLTQLKFKKIENSWVGKINDFYISIDDEKENELIIKLNFISSNRGKLFEFLENEKEADHIESYSINKNQLEIVYKETVEVQLDSFLNEIVSLCGQIEAKCVCTNCEQTQDLSFYTNQKVYSLLCSNCGGRLLSQVEVDNSRRNNYLAGFFASLLGALIGSVAWIAIGALGFFASIAGFAISFCAFKGYELAKGKLSRTGIILNIITILIGFIFAQYAVLFIGFRKEFPEMNLRDFITLTPIIFSDTEILKSLIGDFLLGILFIVLGTFRTIKENFIKAKENKNLQIERVDFSE